jgi:hypothetical protein
VLQTVCNIADDVPPARLIFEARLCNQDISLGFKRRDRSLCHHNLSIQYVASIPNKKGPKPFASSLCIKPTIRLRQNVG